MTIGLIVKDEIRCIERCLKALQPLREAVSCEVIVADTGSTDGTREVAEQYADLVFDFPWINDFAAARNAVMDRASGDWFLSMDADETLDSDVTELTAFLNHPRAKEFTSAFLILNNYANPDDYEQYTPFEANRLLNMSTGLRFQGKIHEVWPDEALKNAVFLRQTILWHDGYIYNGTLTSAQKGKRNMALIERQLEVEPDRLLYLLQAAESSYTTEQAIRYTRRMMEQLKKEGLEGNILGPSVYRDAIRVAGEAGMPEYREWLDEAMAAYPDSLYIQIDVSYMAMMSAQKDHDYAKLLAYGREYMAGIERMERGDFGPNGLRCGTIAAGNKGKRQAVAMSMAMAHARRREWADCLRLLEEYPVETMSAGNVGKWLNVAYFSWEYIDLTALFERAGKAFFGAEPEEEDKKWKQCRDAFIARSNEMFFYVPPTDLEPDEFYPEKPAYPLLVALGDCDLAYGAQVMLEEEPRCVERAAERIEDWEILPFVVPLKVLSLHLPMPERFFEIPVEKIAEYAGNLASKLGGQMIDLLPDADAHSPMERLWSYDLHIGAIKFADWEKGEPEKLMALYRRFLRQSEQFLCWYYHPDILNQDMVRVLPGMHRFAWYCCQAERSLAQGDELAYVRNLRASLKNAPGMKRMVDFLLKRMEQRQKEKNAPPELLELAEKVRQVLAQYQPDDPAVQALKESEAYRRVAYLIEGVEAPVFGGLPQ
ncbi:glycosyltransferase [Pseudoflavonifractor phocaeensis]|uniref:glycosyltransferase n=1 Tax=Pseudoflavonifractor phocaeensis TaxID=1870988 RepID=UPI00195CE075|nr:glycosyltransferase [Pseudoflavonifractor phocaeensis]MBM6724657.1 glycosyltransferase [Pseudoflavonifractor phocaeensis]